MSLDSGQETPSSQSNSSQHGTDEEVCSKMGEVTLQPVTLRIPNNHSVYSPSKLKPRKVVSYQEFLSWYADHPKRMRICPDENPSSATLLQRSKIMTAYGFGWDCWYIVESSILIDGSY